MPQPYSIKQQPEDFLVRENPLRDLKEQGEYSIFTMSKRSYNTESAVQRIADALRIPRKNIGYAGSKDNRAVSEQSISIKGVRKERAEGLSLKDISLKFLGFSDEPINLGDHKGNWFEITVRNIEQKPKPVDRIVNYFGEQRFSTNNAEIGKAMLKKDFKRAAELMMEHSGKEEEKAQEYLEKHRADYVGALRTIPWKNLTMYIHAYQSMLWNETAKRYLSTPRAEAATKIPIVGFATEIDDPTIKDSIDTILKEEGITLQDFVIRAIPDLTSAGSERELYAEVKDLSIGELEDDELNPGKRKVLLKFSLGRGSYATEIIKAMFA
ncbi:MAG: tRNA pseudouridine(13) synthase TruD [archaeon]